MGSTSKSIIKKLQIDWWVRVIKLIGLEGYGWTLLSLLLPLHLFLLLRYENHENATFIIVIVRYNSLSLYIYIFVYLLGKKNHKNRQTYI